LFHSVPIPSRRRRCDLRSRLIINILAEFRRDRAICEVHFLTF